MDEQWRASLTPSIRYIYIKKKKKTMFNVLLPDRSVLTSINNSLCFVENLEILRLNLLGNNNGGVWNFNTRSFGRNRVPWI